MILVLIMKVLLEVPKEKLAYQENSLQPLQWTSYFIANEGSRAFLGALPSFMLSPFSFLFTAPAPCLLYKRNSLASEIYLAK